MIKEGKKKNTSGLPPPQLADAWVPTVLYTRNNWSISSEPMKVQKAH